MRKRARIFEQEDAEGAEKVLMRILCFLCVLLLDSSFHYVDFLSSAF